MTKEEFHSWRKAKGLSGSQCGQLFGNTMNTIYNWESGKVKVPNWAALYIEQEAQVQGLRHALAKEQALVRSLTQLLVNIP